MAMVKLAEVATLEREAVTGSQLNDGLPYVGLEHIESNTGIILAYNDVATGELKSNKFRFTGKHILYGKLRPYLNKVALPDREGMCSTDILPILPDETRIERKFLCYYLRSPRFVQMVSARTTGANLPRVGPNALQGMEIYCPPLPEQQHAVLLLDKASAALAKRRQTLALADDLLKSTFLDLFGDPVKNTKQWPTATLAELGEVDRGISKHRPRNAPELLNGPYPFVQTGDVTNANGYITEYEHTYSEIGLKQSKMWPAGTLCITIAANIAQTAILTFPACFPDSVVGFTPGEKVRTEYIHYFFGFYQKVLEAAAPESAQKNINLKILRELLVPVPTKEKQDLFSTIVNKTRGLKSYLSSSNTELTNLLLSLMNRCF